MAGRRCSRRQPFLGQVLHLLVESVVGEVHQQGRDRDVAGLGGPVVGAVGLDTSWRFMGVIGASGGFIPLTIPELAIYKRTRTEGFAKVELAILDPREGGVLFRSGPVQGTTHSRTGIYLLVIQTSETDTSRLD